MAISAANARSMALVSRFLKQARRIFPPIVTGLTAMLIGTRLIKAGIRNFGGGAAAGETFGSPQNLRLCSFVLTITILCNRFGTELLRIESVVVGLVPGYLVSIPLGQVDFAAVARPAGSPYQGPSISVWISAGRFCSPGFLPT